MPGFTQVFGGGNIYPVQPNYSQLNYAANITLAWPIEQAIAGVPVVTDIIDLNPSAGALVVTLPDARQVSTGFTALLNNISANTTSVNNNVGGTLVSLASGTVWQLYLVDNTTQAGTWRVFQFGAGVSNANASALAGLGLKAISTTLNEHIVINQQVASYNIQSTDRAACVEWVGGSGGVFTGPSPAGVGADWFCYIKNAGTGTLTFNPPSGTVDGGASKSFNPNDSCILICDGTNFITLGFGQAVASSFNFVQIGVTGGNLTLTGAQLNRVSYKFTGVLTSNQTITVPASIQQYWVDNETTGAFTLTVTAGAGATVAVSQGQRAILYCDGTNIVNAVSGSAAPTFPDGTAAAPSITFTSDLTLGLYKAGVDVLGFATAGVARGSISAVGAWTINAPSSGVGLTVNGIGTGNTTARFTDGTAQIDISNGADPGGNAIGTHTNHNLTLLTNNTGRIVITSAGNVTVNAPGSGTTFTALSLTTAQSIIAGIVSAANNPRLFITHTEASGLTDLNFTGSANFNGTLSVGNIAVISLSNGRNVTIAAPSGGTALVVNQLTGQQGLILQGTSPSMLISDTGANGAYLQLASSNASGYTINASYSTSTAGSLNIQTAAVTRIAINSTGNVTINAPSSGTALTVNGLNNTTLFQVADGTTTFGMDITAGHTLEFGTLTNHGIDIFTNNATRIAIAASGGVTINAPASGQALAVTGVANQYTAYFTSANTSGQDFGVTIQAGSTAADFALNIVNRANTLQLMAIAGDGSGQMGPKLTWAANGSVSIAAPTATTNALILNGAANAYTAQFTASSTAGQSFGLNVIAGTNTADTSFAVTNQANTVNYLQVLGNGETAIVQQPGFALQNSTTFDIGYADIPQNLQNVSYATVATDRAKSIDHTSGSAHTYTINDATVNYPVGATISFDNNGAGIVTISLQTTPANLIWAPSGSTGNRSLAQNGVATARKIAAGAPGTWRITGVGLS